jgi:hypothetical protein
MLVLPRLGGERGDHHDCDKGDGESAQQQHHEKIARSDAGYTPLERERPSFVISAI